MTATALRLAMDRQFQPISGAFDQRILKPGEAGTPVLILQQDLFHLGFDPGAQDGVFNGQTVRALTQFEKSRGFKPQRSMTVEIGRAISKALNPQTASAPNPSTPSLPANAPGNSPIPPGQSMVLGYYTQYSPASVGSQDSLAAHTHLISAIAPLWYSLPADAHLHTLGYNHSRIRTWCAQHSVAVYPLVINGGGNDQILNNPALRTQAIHDLVRLTLRDGYPGLNIDFEQLSNADETGLDAFIADLSHALHQYGRSVIVAVGPRTRNNNRYHVYNYQSLGQSADKVVLMTYDYHDNTSSAGPVAPIGWVRQVVGYALSKMPANKILVGLAAYGYNWSTSGAFEIHDNQAVAEAQAAGVPVVWDAAAGEPTFSYRDNHGVSHQVWFENGYSDALKLALVNQDHLGGVAIWRLGDEDAHLWTAIAQTLP